MRRATLFGAVAFSLLPLLFLLFSAGKETQWQYTYTLDDPYIHLALARGIANLHYGINPQEFSSPSSSILWPFLLAPWARLPGFQAIPLIFNIGCLLVTLLILVRLGVRKFSLSRPMAWIAATIVCWCLNIYGLAFTGMEHSLQVVLAATIASSLILGTYSAGFWISVIALPLVRYEGLAISIPVLTFLGLADSSRKRSGALAALAIIGLAMLAFSIFLIKLGLPPLPSSILVKQETIQQTGIISLLKDLHRTRIENTWSLPSFAVFVIACVASARPPSSLKKIFALIWVPATLHIFFGRNGWFGRYEVSILIYLLLMSLWLGWKSSKSRFSAATPDWLRLAPSVIFFLIGTEPLWQSTLRTPKAARNIQDQQVQMSVLVRDYLKQPVAVNDLGAVALNGNQYTLDLWGLGSHEVLRLRKQKEKNPAIWIQELMERKNVKYAIVYDSWFPERPANWIRVFEFILPGRRITPASERVSFYATSPATAQILADSAKAYMREHPERASIVSFSERQASK